jgi:hypothetical protein
MATPSPLRVVAVLPRGTTEGWHRACLDSLRALSGVSLSAGRLPAEISRGIAADVIVDLAETDPQTWTRAPRHGVWRFRFGDGAPLAGGAPGTVARLCRLTSDRDRVIVLHEGWFRAQTADAPGTQSVLDRVAPWCARVLAQIAAGDEDAISARPQPIAGCDDARPPSHAARWRDEAAGALARWVRRERWTVGVVPMGIGEIMHRGSLPEPQWVAGQPADCCYADPFPLRRTHDRLHVLAEAYAARGGPGRIVALEIAADARIVDARDCIVENGQHASYPFLFRHNGRTLCIPETARLGRVSAYCADSSGGTWRRCHDLLDGFPAVDSTIVEHDGRWWLFCTHREEENQTELHVFSASDWMGSWTPHPLNPVKSDARSSRPAGACFVLDGALYRPAQDCSRRYGGAIAINRIVELTERRFREEPVLTLRPAADSAWPDGVHTINSLDGVTVVDGLRVERAPWRRVARSKKGSKKGSGVFLQKT